MTCPKDISRVYQNTEELTFLTLIRNTLTAFGASSFAVIKWVPLHPSEQSVSNSKDHLPSESKSLGQKLLQRQFLPGKELNTLQPIIMENIHEFLQWDAIPGNIIPLSPSSPETKTISLLEWSQDVQIAAATRALFGDRLTAIEPDLFQYFAEFDTDSFKLPFRYPKFLSRDTYVAKDKVVGALARYFELPKEERPGAAWVIDNFENEMRQIGIGNKDIAAIVMAVYWVYVN